MTLHPLLLAVLALALAACSAKAPTGKAVPASGSTSDAPAGSVVQKRSPLSDADIAKSENAYVIAKITAADFIVAHPDASDAEAVAVATAAAYHAADPDAKHTGVFAASDAKGWVNARKVDGFPPRTTPAELAANDVLADAAARRSLAELSATYGNSLGSAYTGPSEPSRGPHYFPKIGTCFDTQVASIGSRLENTPDSGSAVSYTDGQDQVSYETSAAVQAFRVGDPIRLCVTNLPGHCPPADDRGIGFVAVDARTGGSWEANDSEHECGGA